MATSDFITHLPRNTWFHCTLALQYVISLHTALHWVISLHTCAIIRDFIAHLRCSTWFHCILALKYVISVHTCAAIRDCIILLNVFGGRNWRKSEPVVFPFVCSLGLCFITVRAYRDLWCSYMRPTSRVLCMYVAIWTETWDVSSFQELSSTLYKSNTNCRAQSIFYHFFPLLSSFGFFSTGILFIHPLPIPIC